MRKYSRLWTAIGLSWAALACSQSPAFVQPPASEYTVGRFELATGPQVDTIQGATVSPEFLRVIAPRVVIGRLFIGNDFQPTGTPTAVISYDLWSRRFGAEPTIIGRQVRLNGSDAVVVGVTPKNFEFPKGAAVWVPRR